jgi:hypothetical protein
MYYIGQSKGLWCENVFPDCISFYENNISKNLRENKGKNENENENENEIENQKSGYVLIVSDDGILACNITVALLLRFFDTYLDNYNNLNFKFKYFKNDDNDSADINNNNNIKNHEKNNKEYSLIHSSSNKISNKRNSYSKEEIRICLSILQLYVPYAEKIPKRLTKEIYMHFSVFRN